MDRGSIAIMLAFLSSFVARKGLDCAEVLDFSCGIATGHAGPLH
jgi:hypothetical protein